VVGAHRLRYFDCAARTIRSRSTLIPRERGVLDARPSPALERRRPITRRRTASLQSEVSSRSEKNARGPRRKNRYEEPGRAKELPGLPPPICSLHSFTRRIFHYGRGARPTSARSCSVGRPSVDIECGAPRCHGIRPLGAAEPRISRQAREARASPHRERRQGSLGPASCGSVGLLLPSAAILA